MTISSLRVMSVFAAMLACCVFSSASAVAQRTDCEKSPPKRIADIFQRYQASIDKWENEMQRFEQLNEDEEHSDDSILFLGSSSIRLWSTLKEDMAPLPVIQRGYGGAKLCDACYYAERLIHPHEFRAMVVFVANDISGGSSDKTPEEVVALFKYLVGVAREKNADAPIVLIEITPTHSRWKAWPQIKEANDQLKAACEEMENVDFLDARSHFLGDDGTPIRELFRDDQLHLNADGYKLWTGLVREKLDEVLGE